MKAKHVVAALGFLAMLAACSVQAQAGGSEFNVRNKWGRAFGKVRWNFGDIKITGTLVTQVRRTNSFLWLSWDALGIHHNEEVAGVGGGGKHASDHANFERHFGFVGNPSNIKVTVCSQVKGKWRCGVPQGPL